MGRANIGKYQVSSSDSYFNNITPDYSGIVWIWGANALGENSKGDRTISPRTEAGLVITTTISQVSL